MDLTIIASLLTMISPIAIEAFKKALDMSLAEKDIEPIKATDGGEIVRELKEKESIIKDVSTKVNIHDTRKIVDRQLSILEQERDRLTPIASREHILAFVFVVLAGVIFLLAVVLIIFGVIQQAVGTFVASIIPGFISSVFFRREATMEKRISEIAADIRKSEIVRERLTILEEGLEIVPEDNKEEFAKVFIEKHFS